MIRMTLFAAALVASTALAACAKETSPGATTVTSSTTETAPASTATSAAPAPGTETTTTGESTMAQPSYCPMTVAGTSVETMQTASGINLVFKTNTDVTELRRRVHEMAMHMSTAPTAEKMGAQMLAMMKDMPPVHAQVRDIEGGAQIEIAPVETAKMAPMRQHVHDAARTMMSQHDCPMTSESK